ncbi:polysaccharide pyruvyl transferase CsaB [Helicovermis profundi]|uniref:Polysaccharide pyruvyl transferase CsaB n=1 Tax=Helicovermis profundi TaxID=3065157 RepID=A0AAU9EP85_9FIRM|nr:polysaccharide pyruvyl transferase CsaB [Clostridia bacterium S502]
MTKILISGFYGSGNVGDEAILESMINRIKKIDVNAELTVISKNQKSTKRDHKVKTLGRNDFRGFFRVLRKTDILISGGGSLLQDATSVKSLVYYIAVIFSGIIFRKKVMIYSQGIGPINNIFFRFFLGKLLNFADIVTVREENSKKDLIKMGVKKEIYVTADTVIDFDYSKLENNKNEYLFNNDKKTIGLSLKSNVIFSNLNLDKNIKDFIDKILKNYNILFIPFYFNQDIKIIDFLIDNKIIDLANKNIKIIDKELNFKKVLNIMKDVDMLVGERLHSLIFASILNVPFIGMSYDPKIDYFLEDIGLKSIFNINDFNSEILINEVANIFDNEIAFKKDLSYNVQRLKEKLSLNDDFLNDLIMRGYNEK